MNSKQQILLNKIEYLLKFFYIIGFLVVLAMLSEVGKDYIISSFMVFMLIYLFCGLSLPQAFSNLVKSRFQKQQLGSARTIFFSTLLYSSILEGVAMLVAFCFVNKMSAFLHTSKALPFGIALFLPLLFLIPVNEVFRCYYQYYNRRLTVIVSRALGFFTTLVVGLCIYKPLKEYGQKVDALLKSDCMADLYASLTIPISLLAAQVLVCLVLLWMYLVYKPYMNKQIGHDLGRNKENVFSMLPIVAKAHVSANFHKISIYLLVLLAFVFCSFYNRRMLGTEEMNTSFGILAVVFGVTVLIPYFVTRAFSLKYVYRYRKMLKNEDMRSVKAYLWGRTHKYFIIAVALTIFFMVMSKSVIFILTGTTAKQYIIHMQILSLAFVLVPLYSLYNMFLSNIGKTKSLLIINYISLFASAIIMGILYNISAIGGYGISIGVIFYFLIAFICEFFVLERESGFNRNIMQLLVLPAVCAMVMGIILLLLNKAIGIASNRFVELLILLGLLVLCVVIYMVLLLVLRCVDEDELNGGFWGKIIYRLGELLHIY